MHGAPCFRVFPESMASVEGPHAFERSARKHGTQIIVRALLTASFHPIGHGHRRRRASLESLERSPEDGGGHCRIADLESSAGPASACERRPHPGSWLIPRTPARLAPA